MKSLIVGATIVAGTVLALGPAAMAQPGDGGGPEFPKFEEMDKNSDGKVTADEFTGPERFFQRVDSDSDGSVTKAEFDTVRQGRGSRGGGEFDPAQFEERQLEQHKAALKATDEEWAALQPLVKSVLDAQREARGGGFMMRGGFGGPGGGPGGPGGGQGGPGGGPGRGGMSSPEADALRTALESDATSAEDIKAKLEAVRSARATKETKLKTSRDALREVLTARQEAQLVLMGTLD